MKRIWAGGLLAWGLFIGIAPAAQFGVFVGLNKYNTAYVPTNNWLNYCVPDAVDFRTNLLAHGGGWVATNTILLTNNLGSRNTIRTTLSNLAAKAVSGDTVVYYHSSHGGNDDITQANVYLCAYNASYTEDELATDLSTFKTGVKVIVVIDACHSGGLFVETAAKSLAPKIPARQPATPRNWDIAARVTAKMKTLRAANLARDPAGTAKLIVPDEVGWMTACAYYQYSFEDSSIGHGWFTYGLLNGFVYGDSSGDGYATFQELFDFAAPRIPYLDQTPQDYNPTVLATRAGTADATPAGDAWDYADNLPDGATALGPVSDVQTTAVHSLRQDLDESDFFAVPVRRGVCYTFTSTNTSGGGDVDTELYADSEANGIHMIRYAYDIAYPTNLEFSLSYRAFETGTVYLRVKPYFSGGTNMTYTLAYSASGSQDTMGMTNGAPVTIASVAQSGYRDLVLPIPAGQTNLLITLTGGTGDADLYVARDYLPTSAYDYSSENGGNSESISVDNPAAGEWFIEPYGYAPSSNFTVRATYTPGATLVGAASNTATTATFTLGLATNGAHVSIYAATNLLDTGHLNWVLRSNAATIVDGKVSVQRTPSAPGEIISVGKPLDF